MAKPAIDQLWSEFARTWSSHDMNRVLPLYTDDCIYEDVTLGAVNHGKEELRRFGQMFIAGFPDVRFEMTSGFVAANWAGGEWIMTGTHTGNLPGLPATGKGVNLRPLLSCRRERSDAAPIIGIWQTFYGRSD